MVTYTCMYSNVQIILLCKPTADFSARVDVEPPDVLPQNGAIVGQPHLEHLTLAGNLVGGYLDVAKDKHPGSTDDEVDDPHVDFCDEGGDVQASVRGTEQVGNHTG